MVKPNRYIAPKVGITDSGSAVAATKVARQSRRNSHTTSTASAAPSYSSSIEPSKFSCTGSTKLKASVTVMSGCAAFSFSSAARTPAATSISPAPRLRVISKPTTGWPFSSAAERFSATVSMHVRHLVQADAAAVAERDLHARQLLGRLHRGDGAHRLLGAAQVGAAARGLLLHLAQLARDVGGGGVQRLQLQRVELDAHLARDAAHARHRADAAHAEHGLGDVVVDEPAQGLVVHAAGGDGVGQDRQARQLDLGDLRVAQVAGQVGAHARHRVAHVVQRLLHATSPGGTRP